MLRSSLVSNAESCKGKSQRCAKEAGTQGHAPVCQQQLQEAAAQTPSSAPEPRAGPEACIVSRDMHWGQHGHASCLQPTERVGHAQVSESKTPAATADEGTCSGRSADKLLAFYPKRLVFINPYSISLKGLTIYTP